MTPFQDDVPCLEQYQCQRDLQNKGSGLAGAYRAGLAVAAELNTRPSWTDRMQVYWLLLLQCLGRRDF